MTYFRDADGDGYGNPAVTQIVCSATAPAGYVARGGDCNDASQPIHPDAVEICGNGIDDNCDGQIDEGCNNKLQINITDVLVYESEQSATLTISLTKSSDRCFG